MYVPRRQAMATSLAYQRTSSLPLDATYKVPADTDWQI